MYASAVCSGKITPGGKDKMDGGMIGNGNKLSQSRKSITYE